MGVLLRTELLLELLSRVTAELLVALGWRGTAVLVLATLVSHTLKRDSGGPAESGARTARARSGRSVTGGVQLACVTTVLLALLLIGTR